MDKTIILKVNNQEVPMNHFVQNIFIGVVSGLVESLDKLPENKKKIEIKVEQK